MFGMGMNEILIVMVIGVIVIGPKQLPHVARALGKMFAQLKRATNDLKEQVSQEVEQHVDLAELSNMKDSLETEVRSLEHQSQTFLEGEFEEERKIGQGVAEDLRAATDMPSGDYGPVAFEAKGKRKGAAKSGAKAGRGAANSGAKAGKGAANSGAKGAKTAPKIAAKAAAKSPGKTAAGSAARAPRGSGKAGARTAAKPRAGRAAGRAS